MRIAGLTTSTAAQVLPDLLCVTVTHERHGIARRLTLAGVLGACRVTARAGFTGSRSAATDETPFTSARRQGFCGKRANESGILAASAGGS